MKIVIAGATGFIGTALTDALRSRGDSVVVLARDPAKVRPGVEALAWDGRTPGPWTKAVESADAVVNLAGESVAGGRWTPERKLALIRSRVDVTRALAAVRGPKTFVSASAVGYYGVAPAGDNPEDSAPGADFLAALCAQWEREARAAEKTGARVVLTRFGVVLGRGGGALAKMLLPFKLGLGGPLGSGDQPFPWVHLDDAVGAVLFALDTPSLSGAVNVTAPEPADNAAFTRALGRALHRPAVIPAPAFVLRLALGEMAGMLLGGARAAPRALERADYRFRHPSLDEALRSLVG